MHEKIRFDEFLRQGENNPRHFEQMSAETVLGMLKNQIEFPTSAPREGLGSEQRLRFEDAAPAEIVWDARFKAYRPRSVQQVQELVARARAQHVKIRTSGSRHSMERAYEGDGSKDLSLLLDGELRKVEFLEKNDQFARVRVGAGCYIGPNPSDKSLPEAATLSRLLDKEGYALPIVGGITHQSVGGFMQTGSSGGSLQHGFADVVEEIEWVDGRGDVRTVKKGPDEFNAIGVSMGLLGVITHVTLRVPRTYWVEGIEETVDHRDSLLTRGGRGGFRLTEALASTEYLHLNWFPQKYVRRVMQWSGKQVRPDPSRRLPYDNILKDWLISTLGQGVLCTVDRLLQKQPVSNGSNLLIGDLMRRFVSVESRPFRDSWYKTLPSDDQVRVDEGMKTCFTELWLPVEATDKILPILEGMFRAPVVAGNFAVELYGAKSSPFWLSPAHGRNVVRVDPYWWASNKGRPEQYFVHFWNQLMDVEGMRFHWGKYMPVPGQKCGNSRFDLEYLERVYPRLGDWLELRRQMDPEGVFLTNYWRGIFDIH